LGSGSDVSEGRQLEDSLPVWDRSCGTRVCARWQTAVEARKQFDRAQKPSTFTSKREFPASSSDVLGQGSKSKRNRGIEIAHAFVGRSLMQELAGEEVKVSGSTRKMTRKRTV